MKHQRQEAELQQRISILTRNRDRIRDDVFKAKNGVDTHALSNARSTQLSIEKLQPAYKKEQKETKSCLAKLAKATRGEKMFDQEIPALEIFLSLQQEGLALCNEKRPILSASTITNSKVLEDKYEISKAHLCSDGLTHCSAAIELLFQQGRTLTWKLWIDWENQLTKKAAKILDLEKFVASHKDIPFYKDMPRWSNKGGAATFSDMWDSRFSQSVTTLEDILQDLQIFCDLYVTKIHDRFLTSSSQSEGGGGIGTDKHKDEDSDSEREEDSFELHSSFWEEQDKNPPSIQSLLLLPNKPTPPGFKEASFLGDRGSTNIIIRKEIHSRRTQMQPRRIERQVYFVRHAVSVNNWLFHLCGGAVSAPSRQELEENESKLAEFVEIENGEWLDKLH